jgi:hypothetical protein
MPRREGVYSENIPATFLVKFLIPVNQLVLLTEAVGNTSEVL